MTTRMSRQSPVRDFVVDIPLALQAFIGILVHVGAQVFITRDNPSFLCPGVARRALLYDQRVEREMLRVQRQCLVKRLLPVAHCLAGQTKHKIKVDRGKACCPRVVQCLRNLFGRMNAPQRLEQFSVKALRAEAQAVDSGCAQACQLLSIQCAWVGLQRNFSIFIHGECFATGMKQARYLFDSQQAGSASTEKESARAAHSAISVLCQLAR